MYCRDLEWAAFPRLIPRHNWDLGMVSIKIHSPSLFEPYSSSLSPGFWVCCSFLAIFYSFLSIFKTRAQVLVQRSSDFHSRRSRIELNSSSALQLELQLLISCRRRSSNPRSGNACSFSQRSVSIGVLAFRVPLIVICFSFSFSWLAVDVIVRWKGWKPLQCRWSTVFGPRVLSNVVVFCNFLSLILSVVGLDLSSFYLSFL